jgi:hypothetical protein
MDPERWQRIESIFQKALDAGDRRARVLVESCAGDEALRREVETLLAQHENADEFMGRPAFAALRVRPFHRGLVPEALTRRPFRPGRSSATTALWARSAAAVWALSMTRKT